MKKTLSIIILLFVSLGIFAQGANLGIFTGAAYYNGELNQQKVLYMPSAVYGVMYRQDINKRISFRIQADYTILRANDANSGNSYQVIRNHSFTNTYWDFGAQLELNFLDYDRNEFMTEYFSPFISTGAYLAYMPSLQTPFAVAVPVEFGIKYALTKQITIGGSWTYKWTSSDLIDALDPDPPTLTSKQNSYNPDKDLVSFMGAFITFSFYKERIFCPAF